MCHRLEVCQYVSAVKELFWTIYVTVISINFCQYQEKFTTEKFNHHVIFFKLMESNYEILWNLMDFNYIKFHSI